MCLAVPAQVISLENTSAIIDIMGMESEVNVQLIEDIKAGDYILVHAGCGIQKIDANYFNELQKIFQSMLEVQRNNEQRDME